VLAIAVIAGGYWFYRDQNRTARTTAQDQLASIAQLKVDQIVRWRAERLADAAVVSRTPFVSEVISRWLGSGGVAEEKQILTWLESLRDEYGYSAAILVDPLGASLLASEGDDGTLTQTGIAGVREALASGAPLLTDLHEDVDGTIHIDAIAPLFAPIGSSRPPMGAVVLHVKAAEFLFPLVQSWPTPSETAETLLVRREGEAVVFLNELRFQSGTALELSFPFSKSDLPAVMAVQGWQGLVEAPDYRGVKVLADVRPVPGSPWFMVAKMDVSEAFAGTALRSGLIFGLIFVLLVAVIGGSLLVWQWGLKRRYREAYAAEAERRGLLERFEHVVRQAGDMIILADNDLRIIEANDQAARAHGYLREELLTLSISDLLPPGGLAAFERRMAQAEDDSAPTYETTHRRKDGSVFPVEVSDRAIFMDGDKSYQAIIRDTSERKKAQEVLAASEVRYRRLFEAAQDGILILDADTGAVVDANPFLQEMLGYAHEEFLGKAIWELGAFRDLVANKAKFAELRTNEYVRYDNLPLETQDGRLIDVEFVSNSYAANHQRVIQCNIRDISERKAAEAAIRERDEQLQQSQKMEAVGQLAGGIAHDFNNLLTSIIGYSDLLLASERIPDSPDRQDLEEIKRAAERAGSLTRQILAFSRRQALRPEVVSLNKVLTSTEPLLRRTLGEHIDLVSLQHPDLGSAEIDSHQFEQVLINLALNARDAMPSGGRLTLETANVELDEEYCRDHPEASPGTCVMLAVSDTGVGMDEATLERVFEPFFTTKAPGAGTGLGLAMVHGIVKQSGGNIFVYSELGQGTTFKIYLPRVEAGPTLQREEVPVSVATSGSETIMVVEDESSLRALVARVLGEAGYEVVSYGSADAAADALDGGEIIPDLLLTDVVLPGALQGKDLVEKTRASRPDLPILYMSGYTRNAIVHAGRLDEGVNFLEKPFTPEALARKVREVLDQAHPSG